MKNKLILSLFVIATVFSCSVDSISEETTSPNFETTAIENQNNIQTPNSKEAATTKENPVNIDFRTLEGNNNLNNLFDNQTSSFGGSGNVGFGDGFGVIYDGTNNTDSPPRNYRSTALITYADGTTEAQKRILRISYQIPGELLFFEQCSNSSQEELWYLSTSVVLAPMTNGNRDGNPPLGDPANPTYPETVIFIGHTTITGTNTVIRITDLLIGVNPTSFCDN